MASRGGGGGGGGCGMQVEVEAEAAAAARIGPSFMDVDDDDDSGRPAQQLLVPGLSLGLGLGALPFPMWQLVCDCLPSPDILRLATAGRDCRAHARACIRRLTIRGQGKAPVANPHTETETETEAAAAIPVVSAGDGSDDDADADPDAGSAVAGLARLVEGCHRVEEVVGVGLGPLGAAQLGFAWAACPAALGRLRALGLPGCLVGEAGLAQLLPLLPHMPALELLDLDSNSLGTRGARALAWALRPSLEGASAAAGAPEAVVVPSTEASRCCCRRLKVLSLALNGIGASGAAELAAALVPAKAGLEGPGQIALRAGACGALRELHCRNNDMRAEGLRALLSAFAAGACPNLKTFSLDANIMGAPAALILASAFRDGALQDLQVLKLNSTLIGESGTRTLAAAVKAGAWPRLRALELKGNYFRCSETLLRLLDAVEARRGAGLGALQVLSVGSHDNVLTTTTTTAAATAATAATTTTTMAATAAAAAQAQGVV